MVHIYSGELEPEAVKDYSKLFLNIVSTEGYERSGSLFLPVRDSGAKTWREEIVDFIATHRAHYLLMNPAIAIGDELQENETMENCKQIIQQVNCNVVICNH